MPWCPCWAQSTLSPMALSTEAGQVQPGAHKGTLQAAETDGWPGAPRSRGEVRARSQPLSGISPGWSSSSRPSGGRGG